MDARRKFMTSKFRDKVYLAREQDARKEVGESLCVGASLLVLAWLSFLADHWFMYVLAGACLPFGILLLFNALACYKEANEMRDRRLEGKFHD